MGKNKRKSSSIIKNFFKTLGLVILLAGVLFVLLNITGTFTLKKSVKAEIKPVDAKQLNISKDADGYWNVQAIDDEPIKVVQLTDIHLGGGFLSGKSDKLAVKACKKLIESQKPDLIVITGDALYPIPIHSGTINNMHIAKSLVAMMEGFKIPWTMVFGNHDTESFALQNKEDLARLFLQHEYSKEKGTYCLFQRGSKFQGTKKDMPLGNYPIILRNKDGAISQILMMLDSNKYNSANGTFSFFKYDNIHDDQVAWYEKTLKAISSKEPTFSEENLVPSTAFFHIPLKAYWRAYRAFMGEPVEGDKKEDAIYFGGKLSEPSPKGADKYYTGTPVIEGKMFEKMIALNSTKYVFVGHDHLNTYSIEYKGIRLTYGMSIDYLAYAKPSQHFQRGCTTILFNSDTSVSIKQIRLKDMRENSLDTPLDQLQNVEEGL